MSEDRERRIQERAYAMWQARGGEGEAPEEWFWLVAEREVTREEGESDVLF